MKVSNIESTCPQKDFKYSYRVARIFLFDTPPKVVAYESYDSKKPEMCRHYIVRNINNFFSGE